METTDIVALSAFRALKKDMIAHFSKEALKNEEDLGMAFIGIPTEEYLNTDDNREFILNMISSPMRKTERIYRILQRAENMQEFLFLNQMVLDVIAMGKKTQLR